MDCLRIDDMLEICKGDHVEVVLQGGHRYHGIVESFNQKSILLVVPAVSGKTEYILVRLSGIIGLRRLSHKH